MGILLIVLVITFIIANLITHSINNDDSVGIISRIFRHIGGSILGFFIGILVWCLLMGIVGVFKSGEYNKIVKHELISLGDGNSVGGQFVLGCGSIDNKMVYTYYRKEVNGDGIIRRSITASMTKIYEIDSLQSPYLEVHIISGGEFDDDWFPTCINMGNQKYKIFIPKGSIVRDINLDNK